VKISVAKFRDVTLLPFLAFIFAFFIGGVLIVLSDAVVMGQISSPGKFLTSAGAKIGNSYLAIFQGSIFDINLARDSGILNGFYPLSETIVTSTPLILCGLSVALAFRSGLFNIGAQGQFIFWRNWCFLYRFSLPTNSSIACNGGNSWWDPARWNFWRNCWLAQS